jgi:hypothetical protein
LQVAGFSPRVISPLAEELASWLTSTYPDLAAPRYAPSVRAWAAAETRAALLELHLDRRGIVGADGEPSAVLLKELRAEERRASEERRNLWLELLEDHGYELVERIPVKSPGDRYGENRDRVETEAVLVAVRKR